uniref:Glycosyltransferase 2-like domain-containing protein n=1 Tax=Romanomermis culicivorax TaxID=13658 RepID=A0A915JN88_ROMCU
PGEEFPDQSLKSLECTEHELFPFGKRNLAVGLLNKISRKRELTIESLNNIFSKISLDRDLTFGDGFSIYEFNETASRSIGTTYAKLLDQIILIDDCSDSDLLGKQLSQVEKLSVMRNLKREGLIRSRIIGAKKSKSDVLVFLDSHSECNVNWIEPLLQRLMTWPCWPSDISGLKFKEPKAIVCPVIDIIDAQNFQYVQTDENLKGVCQKFSMLFKSGEREGQGKT